MALVKVKILVADDEEIVLKVAGKMLEFLGHRPLLARDGEEAVRLCRAEKELGAAVSVVLLDWRMGGGLGGPETFQRLREIDPEIKGILSSGYPQG